MEEEEIVGVGGGGWLSVADFIYQSNMEEEDYQGEDVADFKYHGGNGLSGKGVALFKYLRVMFEEVFIINYKGTYLIIGEEEINELITEEGFSPMVMF